MLVLQAPQYLETFLPIARSRGWAHMSMAASLIPDWAKRQRRASSGRSSKPAAASPCPLKFSKIVSLQCDPRDPREDVESLFSFDSRFFLDPEGLIPCIS